MERVIDRFDSYMKYKGINDNQVTKDLELSNGLLGKSRKKDRDMSRKIAISATNFYKDLSASWLLAGEGEMLVKDSSDSPLSSLPHQKVEITDKHGSTSQVDAVRVDEMEDYTRAKEIGVSLIPQYEEGFRGGNEGEKDEIKSISTYWGLPNVAGQSMYPVRGDSMAPKYPANCKVVIKDFAFNPAEPFTIPFGETFAIAVNVNGAINYYVKRLFKHPDRDKHKTTYIARSYNPDYEDFEIPIQNIAYLGIVVARVSVDITCNY